MAADGACGDRAGRPGRLSPNCDEREPVMSNTGAEKAKSDAVEKELEGDAAGAAKATKEVIDASKNQAQEGKK